MEKPILTYKELIDAQQEAIEIHYKYGEVNERDAFAILKLNIDLAGDKCLKGYASDGDVRRFICDIAEEYYEVMTPFVGYKYSYDHASESVIKTTCYPHNNESFMEVDEDMEHNRFSSSCEAIEKVRANLNNAFLKKNKLTYGDIYAELGVKNLLSHEQQDEIALQLTPAQDIKDAIDRELRDIHDRIYFPDKLPFGLEPMRMWQTDNGYTTVEWSDGTKTTAKIEDGGRATPYGGFCACVVKKLYGSTGQAIKLMEKADKRVKWPAERKRLENEKLKKLRQARVEGRKRRHERMVQEQMDILYAQREAKRRIAEADEREEDTK